MDNLWDQVEVDRCGSEETRAVLRQIVRAGSRDVQVREQWRRDVDRQLGSLRDEAAATHSAVDAVQGQTRRATEQISSLDLKIDRVLTALEGDSLVTGALPRLKRVENALIDQDRALHVAQGERQGKASAWDSVKTWWPVVLAVVTAVANVLYNILQRGD